MFLLAVALSSSPRLLRFRDECGRVHIPPVAINRCLHRRETRVQPKRLYLLDRSHSDRAILEIQIPVDSLQDNAWGKSLMWVHILSCRSQFLNPLGAGKARSISALAGELLRILALGSY